MLGITTYSELPYSAIPNIAEIYEGSATINCTGSLSVDGIIIGRLVAVDIVGTANLDIFAGANRIPPSIKMDGVASMYVSGGIIKTYIIDFDGVATLGVSGKIGGEGWVRVNPDTPEWDYNESSKWNKIN